jgi:hypothetical protein
MDLAGRLITGCALDGAIETGTFHGDTAAELAKLVPQVWTIELDEALFASAAERFRDHPGVQPLRGPSPEVLTDLSASVTGRLLFWLDAHSLPFDPTGEPPTCPILAEIQAVNTFSGTRSACILIDDARLFLGPHMWYPDSEWPRLLDIVDALREVDDDRYVTILDDVIIAVPIDARTIVDDWWLELSKRRNGAEHYSDLYYRALDPTPQEALRRLVRSVTPEPVRKRLRRRP